MYYTYILKSIKDSRYYFGSTSNLEQRLIRHNLGRVVSTKFRRPFVVHYYEVFSAKSAAFNGKNFSNLSRDANGSLRIRFCDEFFANQCFTLTFAPERWQSGRMRRS